MTHANRDVRIQSPMRDQGFNLVQAVLLYRAKHGRDGYATVHEVDIDADGSPLILAGRPMTRASLRKWTRLANNDTGLQLLAPNVIARNRDTLVWWTPPVRRTTLFDLNDSARKGRELATIGKRIARPIPYPSLVFAASAGNLTVFAFDGAERPTADTELCHAPILNIYENGTLCWGSVQRPPLDHPDVIALHEDAVFSSWGRNTNFQDRMPCPGGLVGLLDRLAGDPDAVFPTDMMVPVTNTAGHRATISQLLAGLSR